MVSNKMVVKTVKKACTDCKLNSIEADILIKKWLKGGEGDR